VLTTPTRLRVSSVLAGTTNTAFAGHSAAKRATYSWPPMSDHSRIEGTPPQLAIHQTMGAAIGTVLALIAVADALIIVALYPALGGLVFVVATGVGIAAFALAIPFASAAFWRNRLPNNNDGWVFW
jgi:hypothetical protein